tara:strand:- start:396 stop:530 length:135 start_codon:yes stop_codon:yes gene_type:complete
MDQNTFNKNIKLANKLVKEINKAVIKGDTNKAKVIRLELSHIKL